MDNYKKKQTQSTNNKNKKNIANRVQDFLDLQHSFHNQPKQHKEIYHIKA